MCLPWNHKWETVKTWIGRTWDVSDDPDKNLPRIVTKYIQQRCSLKLGGCGKEIVRKYGV